MKASFLKNNTLMRCTALPAGVVSMRAVTVWMSLRGLCKIFPPEN